MSSARTTLNTATPVRFFNIKLKTMQFHTTFSLLCILVLTCQVHGQRVVLTNDDGWATASIRAQYDSLKAAGFDVILSCPAVNKSGTGSSSAPPTTLTSPCQFNTCPTGSPAEGSDPSDPRVNYVNSFPVDAVRFGIQTLSPRFFGTQPDFVVSGPNIGTNLGTGITGSGTVGAASEAALEGIPSVAFSGSSGSSVIFTTLTSDPTSTSSVAARVYAALSTTITQQLISSGTPFLPRGVSVNVNYSPITNCRTASTFKFVFTRITATTSSNDALVCGSNRLPDESSIIHSSGCFATISVFNATTKRDVDAATQAVVVQKLGTLLSCP